MSLAATVWAWSLDHLPPRDKFVLIALADHHNEDEDAAWMKQDRIAQRTGYTRQTVNAALIALEHEHGLITSRGRRYPDGRNATKVYRLNMTSHVKETDTDEHRVKEADTDRVKETDTDSVKSFDNKNLEHRTKNIELRKGSGKKKAGAEIEAPPPPEHADPEVWERFRKHRRQLRRPLTPEAVRLIARRLAEHPQDANEMLENSIANGWTGVFPLRRNGKGASSPEESAARDAIDLYHYLTSDGGDAPA